LSGSFYRNSLPVVTFGVPPTAAERMVQSLRELHERLARQLDDDEAPVWFLHLPIPPVPIRRIETEEPFVRFIGFGATAGRVDLMLVVPEPVAITIESPRLGAARHPVEFD